MYKEREFNDFFTISIIPFTLIRGRVEPLQMQNAQQIDKMDFSIALDEIR